MDLYRIVRYLFFKLCEKNLFSLVSLEGIDRIYRDRKVRGYFSLI